MTSHWTRRVAGADQLAPTRGTASSLTVAASLFVALLALASNVEASPPPTDERCVFDTYAPSAVEAYYLEDIIAFGSGSKILHGAQLYVPAREGLSKEWLEASIRQAFATPSAEPAGCLPNVRNVEISVGSGGGGFWIYLGSVREASALLHWAQTKLAH
jgi:hypothetical protein